jgi:hypothetical protein
MKEIINKLKCIKIKKFSAKDNVKGIRTRHIIEENICKKTYLFSNIPNIYKELLTFKTKKTIQILNVPKTLTEMSAKSIYRQKISTENL